MISRVAHSSHLLSSTEERNSALQSTAPIPELRAQANCEFADGAHMWNIGVGIKVECSPKTAIMLEAFAWWFRNSRIYEMGTQDVDVVRGTQTKQN